MGSEQDDLQSNPLFQAFMASEYFGQAAKQRLIVCVPAAASLKLVRSCYSLYYSIHHTIIASSHQQKVNEYGCNGAGENES
jgi:hypothetical protein